jgi:preflagellin peptidase FlaK
MIGVGPDILRLTALPIIIFTAWSDFKIRRVDAQMWPVVFFIGGTAAVWQISLLAPLTTPEATAETYQIVLVPLLAGVAGAVLQLRGAIGAADSKALFTLALLYPTEPAYYFPNTDLHLPLVTDPETVFLIGILMNSFVFGSYYLLKLWIANLRAGDWTRAALTSQRVPMTALVDKAGRAIIIGDGERQYLDTDILRMYLRWRGLDRSHVADWNSGLADPTSIECQYEIGTGAIDSVDSQLDQWLTPENPSAQQKMDSPTPVAESDRWGADAFLHATDESVDHLTESELRAVFDALTNADEVRLEPGAPLLVPVLFGLLTAITVGELVVVAQVLLIGGVV